MSDLNEIKRILDLKLNTSQGYFLRYFQLLAVYKDYQTTYEALEDEYMTVFNKNKYSSYESFKNAKSKFQKCIK
jgi:hypothetical protein